jgi:hypothetical protein
MQSMVFVCDITKTNTDVVSVCDVHVECFGKMHSHRARKCNTSLAAGTAYAVGGFLTEAFFSLGQSAPRCYQRVYA